MIFFHILAKQFIFLIAIRQQRIFMAILGYAIVFLAYMMAFMPSTVISIANMVSLGCGCTVASAFIHSIFIPKMNVKGLLAGYVSAMLPIIISLVGIFIFPRPDDRNNETIRDISECLVMFEVILLAKKNAINLSISRLRRVLQTSA